MTVFKIVIWSYSVVSIMNKMLREYEKFDLNSILSRRLPEIYNVKIKGILLISQSSNLGNISISTLMIMTVSLED